jgi:hypothetical protein
MFGGIIEGRERMNRRGGGGGGGGGGGIRGLLRVSPLDMQAIVSI